MSKKPQTGIGFESLSLPVGNGYMGINIFGGTEQELLSIAENSMHNPPNWQPSPEYGPEGDKRMKEHNDGLNTLSKVYLDFAHPWQQVTNYRRELRLNDAIASVAYEYAGVEYLREYFCSYPDKVAVLPDKSRNTGKKISTVSLVNQSIGIFPSW